MSVHEKKKPFRCEICDNSYSRKDNMTQHVLTVHENKNIKCRICDKRFTTKQTMKIHDASIHKEMKPYKCEICNYSCSAKGSMKIIFYQFIRKRNHRNVKFVTTFVFKKEI